MKKKMLVISLIIFVGALIAYEFRIYIATRIWHMRHGTSLTIGNYTGPIPMNWYVQDIDGVGPLLYRLDTDDHTPTKRLKAHASISLLEMSMQNNDRALAIKRSLDVGAIKKYSESVLQHTFTLNDGTDIQCVGAYTPGSNGILDVDPGGWTCSSLGLDIQILATEPDMNQVWEIISGIRKKT